MTVLSFSYFGNYLAIIIKTSGIGTIKNGTITAEIL